MKKKASTAFERFRWSCFDDSFGAIRDGLDVEATSSLMGDDRAHAESLILTALQTTIDSRPFEAAGILCLTAASPILKHRLSSGFGSQHSYLRVHAAHALHKIEEWGLAANVIIDVLINTPKTISQQWTRMMAVEALADFPADLRCREVLFAAVEDKDDFIGFLAIQSLKKVYEHDASTAALLATLEKTQIKPNRWNRSELQRRHIIFQRLEATTGIEMPAVASKPR